MVTRADGNGGPAEKWFQSRVNSRVLLAEVRSGRLFDRNSDFGIIAAVRNIRMPCSVVSGEGGSIIFFAPNQRRSLKTAKHHYIF
jgi:hypothetical protein